MKKKLLSMCLAAALAVTMAPWTALQGNVYAAEDPPARAEDQVTEQDTEEEALEQLEACKQKVAQAEADLKEKAEAYEAAKEDYQAADQVYKDKKTASEQAKAALEEAKAAAEEAAADLEDAEAAKAEAETALSDAKQDLAAKQEALTEANNAVPRAEANLARANTQWEAEQEAAAEELTAAQEAYDNAGYNFINSKVDAMGSKYYNIDEIIANEKNSSYSVNAWNGATLTMGQIARDQNFKAIAKSACSYENLKQGIDYINHTNALRTNERHNLSALKVNYQLMANAIVSAAVCAYAQKHNLLNSSENKYWQIDGFLYGTTMRYENLAYSSGWNGYDPFDGWYYDERIAYLGGTQDAISQVKNEAISDGRTGYSNRSTTATGHYLAIIHPDATSMGAAYTYLPNSMNTYGSGYPAISTLEFNYMNVNNITVSQYESELDNYFASYENALSAAEDAVETLKTAPEYVTNAEQDLEDAKAAAAQAKQELNDAEDMVAEAEQDLADAKTDLTEKQTANDKAIVAEKAAQVKADNAAGEETAAKATAEEKQGALDAAENAWTKAKGALTTAEENRDSAQAIYDAFFILDNGSIDPIADQVYTGAAQEPEVKVWNKGHTKQLTADDYTLTFDKNTKAGTASVKAEGKGKYSGNLEASFTISPADIAKADAAKIEDRSYTGKEIKAEPELTFNEAGLEKGTDYEITGYENNIELGTAAVTIEGKGNFKGTATLNFQIVPAQIGQAQIAPVEDQTYTGKALTPKPVVTFNDEELQSGTDYQIAGYENNVKAGEGTITIEGLDRFTDTASVSFKILPAGLDKAQIGQIEAQTYTGRALTPQPVITFNDEELQAGTDYEIAGYENNTDAGKATVTIEGKGNFKGEVTADFNIAKADISKAQIADMDPVMNTGEELTPKPVLTFNDAAMEEGTDYEITGYENNVEIGTATISLEGIGNFEGTTQVSFQIIKNDGGYSKLPEGEQKAVDKIVNTLDLDTAQAMEVYNYAQEAGIPADTLLVTDEAVLKGNTDSDVKGAHFSPLTAKASKTAKTSITIKWTKNSKADGYKIYGNLCGKTKKAKLLKTIKTNGTTSFTQKKLKKGKYYKYIVVAYKEIGGKQITVAASPTIHAATAGGKVGNDKKVTTKAKKNKVTVKTGKTFKLAAKAVPVSKKAKVKKHRAVSYDSANKAIATVSSKGVIKGVKKGSCYVYAYAQNGVFAKIKVTVK